MSSSNMKSTIDYYANYNEDDRLIRHPVEFVTTTLLLNRLVMPASQILDVATGTGVYALQLAQRGHVVVARDIVPQYIEQLNAKLQTAPLPIKAEIGDARDLSPYGEGSFDVVLCMGPIYHVPRDEIVNCLQGCLRVLKPGGILFGAYVNRFAGYEEDQHSRYFLHYTSAEIETLFASLAVRRLHHVPVDGTPFEDLEPILSAHPSDLAVAHQWLADHESVFKRLDDTFIHGLYIAQKTSE